VTTPDPPVAAGAVLAISAYSSTSMTRAGISGPKEVLSRDPVIMKIAAGWLILNVDGDLPTSHGDAAP
jgi:hypothetical protein